MINNKRAYGKLGEQYAVGYLKNAGYEIIGCNIYIGHAEIDIVARNNEYLIFAEVKTRTELPDDTDKFGRPAAAVNRDKKSHLIFAATEYTRLNPHIKGERKLNIDVIEIYADPAKKDFSVIRLNHIKNAVKR